MVESKHVISIDGIGQSLNVFSIFVRFLRCHFTVKPIAFTKLKHKAAYQVQSASNLSDRRILFLQAFYTEKPTLTQDAVRDIQDYVISVLYVLRDRILNMIVRNRKSLSAFCHIPLRRC